MKVHKPIGSKERLFEMFERVNKIKLNENYEVHYSDGVRSVKNFSEPNSAIDFMKSEIKNNPSLKNIQLFKADQGFHTTTDDERLIKWWGDGSYFDNVSKRNPELLKKKLELDESFDNPKKKDKKYLDKTSGDQTSQVSKYDGAVDYPANRQLKVNHNSLEKLAEEDSVNSDYLDIIKSFLSSKGYLDGGEEGDNDYLYQNYIIRLVPYILEGKSIKGVKGDGYITPDDADEYEIIKVGFNEATIFDSEGNVVYQADENALNELKREFGKRINITGDLYDEMVQVGYNDSFDMNECECEKDSEEDKILDPSTHWSDHYVAKNFTLKEFDNQEEIVDEYIPAMNEESSEKIEEEIYDELEMRYSPSRKTISFNDIVEVSQMYDVDEEYVAEISSQVISDQLSNVENEFIDDIKDLIKRIQNSDDLEIHKISPITAWEVFEYEYESGDYIFDDFAHFWEKFTKNPNQLNMFENVSADRIVYDYNKKGIFVPRGFEDKNVGIRPDFNSSNTPLYIVALDTREVIDKRPDWKSAKNAIYDIVYGNKQN